MHTTAALTWVLSAAPASPTNFDAVDVSDYQVGTTDGATTLTTYDADAEVSSEIIVQTDADGELVRLDATFADGGWLHATIDGAAVTVESDDPAKMVERLIGVENGLAELTEDEANDCLAAILSAAYGCGTHPILCAVGGFAVHKWCIKAWQEDEDSESEEPEDEDE